MYVHIGGGVDHIGAVALAGTRPDGAAYAEVLCVPPHKEGEPALAAARTIQRALGVNVCVTAGFHLDDITRDEIAEVLQNMNRAVAEFVTRAYTRESGKLTT